MFTEAGGGAAGGAAGGVAGGILGTVLSNMHLGGLYRRVTGQAVPHIGQAKRQRVRAIPGVTVDHGMYSLPALNAPKGPFRTGLWTNSNAEVLRYLKQYQKYGLASSSSSSPGLDPNRPRTSSIPPTGIPGVPWMPTGQWDDMVSPEPAWKCSTDAECEQEFYDRYGTWPDFGAIEPQAFVGAPGVVVPSAADVVIGGAASTAGAILARIMPWLLIFLPSSTEDLPWYDPTLPKPQKLPKPEPQPQAWPEEMPEPQPQAWPEPQPAPQPKPQDQPEPVEWPQDIPHEFPDTSPWPAPPAAAPWLPSWLPDFADVALPLLLPALIPTRGRARKPGRVRDPLTADQPDELALPLESPYPYRTDECNCEQTKKKRKKSCSNPISSKRTFTRGSQKFRTITRRINCVR